MRDCVALVCANLHRDIMRERTPAALDGAAFFSRPQMLDWGMAGAGAAPKTWKRTIDAHRREQQDPDRDDCRNADGRSVAPLLVPDRRGWRARGEADQTRAPARR